MEICKLTPNVKHWLPTREYKIVRDFLHWESFPSNLTVRLSAHKIDEKPPKTSECQTSTVNKDKPALGVQCESFKQDNKCLDCRLCWDKSIDNISYKYH